jgi:hypothetical protein
MKAEPRRTTNHERYTSNNVLLGRLETSKGVYLLQRIEMSDLLYDSTNPAAGGNELRTGSGNLRGRLCLDGVKIRRTNITQSCGKRYYEDISGNRLNLSSY